MGHSSGPGIELLTSCQANKTRVAVRTVRMDTTRPGIMDSLTCCQANRTRVAVRTVTQLDLAWNYSPSVKPIGPEW